MQALLRTFYMVLFAMLINTGGHAADFYGPHELTAIVGTAYQKNDFSALDKLATKLRTEKSRTPSGQWNLSVFYANLESEIKGRKTRNSNAHWNDTESKINRWVASAPYSAMGPIALAIAQYSHAWDIRGHGFASTVNPKDWDGFQKQMAIAHQTLMANKKISSDDPQWYVLMMKVALAEQWPKDRYMNLYDEAATKEPLFYETYREAAEYFLPMWGGNMQQIQDFATDAVRRTASTEGQGLYARIYWPVSKRVGEKAFFAEPHRGAVWSKMKSGFEDLIKKYPVDWNRNAYARFACQLGDVDLFISQVRAFESKPMDADAWPGDSFQICQDWAGRMRPKNPP